jgi:hypothetical protein
MISILEGYWLGLGCLTSLSIIFQLYRRDQFLLAEETEVSGENPRPVKSQ